MSTRLTRAALASYPGFDPDSAQACLSVLARDADLHLFLAANPALPAPVWRTLWGRRPAVRLAELLVSRPLCAPERALVLAKEARVGVLTALIAHNELGPTEQAAFLAAPPAAAAALLRYEWVAPELRRDLAVRAGDLALLEELSYDPSGAFSDAEAAELLASFGEWAPRAHFRERAHLLRVLLHMRPGLLDVAVASDADSVLTAAAGSVHLTSRHALALAGVDPEIDPNLIAARPFALLALVNNPVVALETVARIRSALPRDRGLEQVLTSAMRRDRPAVTEPFSEVGDPDQLRWLLRRALPSEYHPGRPLEQALLVMNPHVDPDDQARLVRALAEADPRLLGCFPDVRSRFATDFASLRRPRSVHGAPEPAPWWQGADALCRRLAADPGQWETAVGLLDQFDGSADELAEMVARL